jgi:hypothetical protein
MKAADTSASIATAAWTPLTVVSRSRTTAEIDTFISDVSMTNTNIAAASRMASRGVPARSSDSGEALVRSVTSGRPARAHWGCLYDSAFALSASNSSWVIVPASSSSFAFAISAADPPAASRTYWSNACF